MALQFALPSRTPLPADPGLAPRRIRDPVRHTIPPYPTIVSASLFTPERHESAQGGPASPGAPSPDFGGYMALGVTLSPHGASALVGVAGARAAELHVGASLDGWRLAGLTSERLVFQRGAEQRILQVGEKPTPSTLQPAVAASDGPSP